MLKNALRSKKKLSNVKKSFRISNNFNAVIMVDIVEIIETVDIVKAICYKAGLEFKQPQKCHWITS